MDSDKKKKSDKVKKASKYEIVFPPIDLTFEEAMKKIVTKADETMKQRRSKPAS